jgi:hypothetical protein
MVVALIALFLALGGIGYAAATIDTNDIKNGAVTTKKIKKKAVTAKKIKQNAVKTPKIADNAVTTPKIADGAVTVAKLGQVRRVVAVSPETSAANDTREVQANCPEGEVLIAGGAAWTTTADNRSTVNGIIRTSRPIPSDEGLGAPTGWQASGQVENAFVRQLRAYALCLPA